MKLASTSAIN